jgi:hypothetical protein
MSVTLIQQTHANMTIPTPVLIFGMERPPGMSMFYFPLLHAVSRSVAIVLWASTDR